MDPLLVGAGGYVFYPGGIIEVPLDGLAEAGLKGFLGSPAQLMLQLAGVDGVAAVMAGTVLCTYCNSWTWGRCGEWGTSSSSSAQRVVTTSRLVRWLPPPTL